MEGIAVIIPVIVFNGSPGSFHAQFQCSQGAETAGRGGGRPEGNHIEFGEKHVDFCQVLAGEFNDPHARIGTVFNQSILLQAEQGLSNGRGTDTVHFMEFLDGKFLPRNQCFVQNIVSDGGIYSLADG